MVIKSAELKNVVGVTTRKLPDTGLPEIAFAGTWQDPDDELLQSK